MDWEYALFASIILGALTWYYFKGKKPTPPSLPTEEPTETLGRLHIYVGSQTGHSQKLAEILAQEATKYNFSPHIIGLDHFQILDFKKNDFCVIFCSTQSDGNAPPNATKFLKWVTKVAKASHDDLSRLSYCVFGLRKSSHSEIANVAAKTIDDSLANLGANQIIRLGDAIEDDVEEFNKWKNELWKVLPSIVKKSRRSQIPSSEFLEVAHNVVLTAPNPKTVYEDSSKTMITSLEFPVIKIKELKRDPKNSALHVEMETSVPYETAGNFGIFPENDEELVRELAALQDYDLELTFQFLPVQGKKHPFPTPLTVGEALIKYCDITSLVRKKTLKNLANFATNPDEKQELEYLASLKGKDEYRRVIEEPMLTIVELFKRFSSLKVPIGALVQVLDRIQPRMYTIASSSKLYPKSLQIAVEVLRQRTCEGKIRTGLCSGYFEKMHITGLYKPIRGFFKTSAFIFPPQPVPIVMICNGCGVAPFRAFLQELKYLATQGEFYPETIMYFGCKNKVGQFVYKRDLESFIIPSENSPGEFEHRPEAWGEGPHVLKSLYVASSRAQAHKIYVQDLISSHHDSIWDLISNKGCYIYVCGSSGMGKAVGDLIKNIATEHLGEDSTELFKKLCSEGRYAIELWG